MSDADSNAREILLKALEQGSAEQIHAHIDQACGDDSQLRLQVEALLQAHWDAQEGSPPAPGQDSTVDLPVDSQTNPQLGPYKLLQEIGEGGMGVVYMADQTRPVERRVALKIVKPGMDTRLVIARFEAERQALAMMDHPNIARVLDAGTTETDRPYFVMELVKGVPITEYCDQKHLTTRERLELFVPVCQAVQHAHQKGIIHRDLKPSNVLVALYDGRPVPKVIDFGVAKAMSHKLTEKTMFTQFGQIVGTIEYMSPEQAELNQLDVDTRSDVYSLGVLLYELLTGETPFDKQRLRSAALDELLRIIREEEPPRPSTKLSSSQNLPSVAANRRIEPQKLSALVRGELDWIVMKAIEKDRTDRYETALGLAMDIERYLNNEPVTACPPSGVYRLRKFVRRHRASVVAASLVVATLLIGIAGTTWGMVSALKQQARVARQAETAADGIDEANRIVIATFEELATEFGDFTPRMLPTNDASEFEGFEVDALGIAAQNLAIFFCQSLKDETRSRHAAERTAEVLKQIASFQSDQKTDKDLQLMGTRLRANVLQQVRAYAQRLQLEPDQVEAHVADVDRLLSGADFAMVAKSMLEASFFTRALRTIDTEFKDQPLVRADLLQTIAGTLVEMELDDLARDVYKRSHAIYRAELGEQHPETLRASFKLGSLAGNKSEDNDALEHVSVVHEHQLEILGAEHRDTLRSAMFLGELLTQQARYDEAEPVIRATLESQRRVLGSNDLDTLQSITRLGSLLQEQGRFADAESLLREAVEISRGAHGDGHRDTLASILNLGFVLQAQAKVVDAQRYFDEALENCRRALGNDHPLTLETIYHSAKVRLKQRQYSAAEPFFREALRGQTRCLGLDHTDTRRSVLGLGEVLVELNQFKEAEQLLTSCHESCLRTLGTKHEHTLISTSLLGTSIAGQGRFAEAKPLLVEAYAAMKDTGVSNEQKAGALQRIINLYEAWHDAEPNHGHGAKASEWRNVLENQR